MKKIIALIVVVVIYLASSYTIGHYSKTTMERQAEQISAAPGYQAEITDFRHGLFSSSMKLNIDLDTDYLFGDLEQQDIPEVQDFLETLEEEGVVYDISVFQGPLVFHKGIYPGLLKAEFRLSDEQEWVQEIREALDTETLIDNTLAVNYFGKGSGYLRIDPTDFQDEELELNFGGMDIEFELKGYGQRYTTSGVIQPTTISADDGTLSLSAFNFSGHGELSAAQVNPGRFDIAFDSMSFNDGVQTLFSMSGVNTTFEAKLDDNDSTFTMDYKFSIDSIESPQFNPGISGIDMDLGLLNLDREGFNTFYEAAMEASEMQDEFQAQMAMMQATSQLLTGTPRLVIRKLSYEQGPDITLNIGGHLGLAQDISANAGNPFAAMAALEAELDMNFTEQFYEQMVAFYVDSQLPAEGINEQFRAQMREQQINQYDSMVQQMLANGYLQQENNKYNLKANMANGEININGMPLAIPFF